MPIIKCPVCGVIGHVNAGLRSSDDWYQEQYPNLPADVPAPMLCFYCVEAINIGDVVKVRKNVDLEGAQGNVLAIIPSKEIEGLSLYQVRLGDDRVLVFARCEIIRIRDKCGS